MAIDAVLPNGEQFLCASFCGCDLSYSGDGKEREHYSLYFNRSDDLLKPRRSDKPE